MRDLLNDIQFKRGLSPVATPADNTAQVSQILDRAGYDSAGFVIATGALPDADATFTVLVEEGDVANLSDAAAVADADLIGQDPTVTTAPETQASFTFAADDNIRKIGYRGTKRYLRLTITPAANASASLLCVIGVLGRTEVKPVVQATA
jgi:hypothetical protein